MSLIAPFFFRQVTAILNFWFFSICALIFDFSVKKVDTKLVENSILYIFYSNNFSMKCLFIIDNVQKPSKI